MSCISFRLRPRIGLRQGPPCLGLEGKGPLRGLRSSRLTGVDHIGSESPEGGQHPSSQGGNHRAGGYWIVFFFSPPLRHSHFCLSPGGYSFDVTSWGRCDVCDTFTEVCESGCDKGMQYRTFKCLDKEDNTVDSSLCLDAAGYLPEVKRICTNASLCPWYKCKFSTNCVDWYGSPTLYIVRRLVSSSLLSTVIAPTTPSTAWTGTAASAITQCNDISTDFSFSFCD